jgi:hypothetical protein
LASTYYVDESGNTGDLVRSGGDVGFDSRQRTEGRGAWVDTCPLSGEMQIQTGHRAAFSNWNRLVTVLCGRRSNTALAASTCYNRPNDADSWRNHKNIFAVIFP